jgi:hypothetical protein
VNLDFAILADSVSLGGADNDKLFIHGAPLRRIDVPQLPWAAAMGIGISFTAPLEEVGERHSLGIRITGPPEDKEVLEPFSLPFSLPNRTQDDWARLGSLLAIDLGVIGFGYDGWYTFALLLDNSPLTELQLRIVVDPTMRDRLLTPTPVDA